MKAKISLLSVIIVAFLMSCQNDEIESLPSQGCENMLYFETIDDCVNELNKVLEMNEEDRVAWEASRGFKSLGLESERFCASIEPKDFKSVEEVKQFVKKNSNFLQLVEDNNGEYELDARLGEAPFSILANRDGFFQVGNRICKVYKDAVVSADEQHIDKLKSATIDEALLFSDVLVSANMVKSSQSGCSAETVARCDNGNERIRLSIGSYICEGAIAVVYIYYEARPYNKILGIWYRCRRTISCEIDMNIYYQSAVDNKWVNWNSKVSNPGEKAYVISQQMPIDYCVEQSGLVVQSYDCWAKQANTNKAYAICN